MLTRRLFLSAVTAFACATGALAQSVPMFFSTGGVAISGFDAVSYFDEAKPRLGNADHSLMWKGAIWHFATAENRELFERNPRAYAPQFGGYCAYAMILGQLSSTDPDAWKIVNNRLYLTHSPQIERIWAKNEAENIALAENHWPAVLYD